MGIESINIRLKKPHQTAFAGNHSWICFLFIMSIDILLLTCSRYCGKFVLAHRIRIYESFFFVRFVSLRPESTATVMAGRPVHPTTLSPGQA